MCSSTFVPNRAIGPHSSAAPLCMHALQCNATCPAPPAVRPARCSLLFMVKAQAYNSMPSADGLFRTRQRRRARAAAQRRGCASSRGLPRQSRRRPSAARLHWPAAPSARMCSPQCSPAAQGPPSALQTCSMPHPSSLNFNTCALTFCQAWTDQSPIMLLQKPATCTTQLEIGEICHGQLASQGFSERQPLGRAMPCSLLRSFPQSSARAPMSPAQR